jgi:hypothetical protein
MKDKIERYEIHYVGRPDRIILGIKEVEGKLYEVHTKGLIRAGLSRVQKADLEERKLGITINLESSVK